MKPTAIRTSLIVLGILSMAADSVSAQGAVRPLANDFITVCESPDPQTVYCYTPGLARLPSGRLVATMDLGGRDLAKHVDTTTGPRGKSLLLRGKVFTSDDHGKTWTYRAAFPFGHARPFVAGKALYVLGQSGDLMVTRSDDDGLTWSAPAALTDGEHWHQSACNVHYTRDCVYLVMEKQADRGIKSWAVGSLAPVLMRGRVWDDLTDADSWTFASELVFEDAVDFRELDFFGVPFFEMDPRRSIYPAPRRNMAPIGWLETNVVQIIDPDHYWYDPDGRTFHLLMRAHTGGTGLAAICKVVEAPDGSMTTGLETVPSAKKIVYVPMPGGQMRFHLLYDPPSKRYWLLSSQAVDSMTRAERLPANRYNLPNNERHRLQLHFSKNCVDWCFAGMVAIAPDAGQGRHYASMVIDGDDLHVLSRSGDHRAKSAHDGNLITFHTIKDFRRLVY